MNRVLINVGRWQSDDAAHTTMLGEAGFEVVMPDSDEIGAGLATEEAIIEALKGVQAVIAGIESYSDRVLSALPELRVIARFGVGYDQVDVAAASSKGIVVTITPTAVHEAVAEHTMALIFALAKNIIALDRRTRAGGWRFTPTLPIRGQTLGVVGLGRIGRCTALHAKAVGMKVIATEKFPDPRFAASHEIELVALDELLARADYVSLHCPLNDETNRMFNRELFNKMKPGSALINTTRGGVIDEADLLDALRNGPLRAAALDVFQREPADADNPLFQLDNIITSPHVAGADVLAQQQKGIEAARCIIQLQKGQWPNGAVVNDQLRTNWKW